LAHGYHTLSNWNYWLSQQFLGKSLLDTEKQVLTTLLDKHFGKHALLIGVSHQQQLLEASSIPRQSILSPLISRERKSNYYIESNLHELPILTGSIDLVMLPHTLEFVDNPRQLLSEACRIIKPEGLIVICGFNPYSLWGLRRLTSKQKTMPWRANFIHSFKVKNWLRLADFALEKHKTVLFKPPISRPSIYNKLHFLEQLGGKCFPALGGVYILLARAKVIPLTPIKLKWKQQLSGIRISTTLSGHAR
jgi:SAM-dependent methyltransferase